jgi:hypothetical protein
MNAGGAKLWIVMGRPTRLPGAMIAVDVLGRQFPGGCHLLRDDSSWWNRAAWQQFVHRFAGAHQFRRVPTCRGLLDVPRLYRDLSVRKAAVAALPIDPQHDVLLCLASVTGLANAAASVHRGVRKILCIAKADYERLNQAPERLYFRFTTSGWLQNRLIEPLLGLDRTLHFKPRINPGGDGVRLVRLEKNPGDIYDKIVVMSNSGCELPSGRRGAPAASQQSTASEQLLASRFPSIAELDRPGRAAAAARVAPPDTVVFFGTPFFLVYNLPPNEYVIYLNRCLDFIRTHYPGRRLLYRPHPAETAEASQLNLAGFEIEDDREAAELYFLRRFAEIEAVYSVSSTVSRVALNNGLNAYALWRSFSFPETAARFFEAMMGDVPPEFDIADLGTAPIPYQHNLRAAPGTFSFSEALKLAVSLELPRRSASGW